MANITSKNIQGQQDNGQPYKGLLVTLPANDFGFGITLSKFHKKSLETYIKHYQRRTKNNVGIAWSGIKVLNEETARENYLPESFAGCPQGFVINDGQVLNPPLFNKAALLMDKAGTVSLKHISTKGGITLSCRSHKIEMDGDHRNLDGETTDLPDFCFYDLLYEKDYVYANGRVIVQMGGNQIKEVIYSRPGQKIPLQPSGLTLSVADEAFPPTWDMRDKELDMSLVGLENIQEAVELGPMLLDNGLPCHSLEQEGWLSKHAIVLSEEERKNRHFDCPGVALGVDVDNQFVMLILTSNNGGLVKLSCVDVIEILLDHNLKTAASFAPDWTGAILLDNDVLIDNGETEELQENTSRSSCAIMGFVK